jgi:hypothetical protein
MWYHSGTIAFSVPLLLDPSQTVTNVSSHARCQRSPAYDRSSGGVSYVAALTLLRMIAAAAGWQRRAASDVHRMITNLALLNAVCLYLSLSLSLSLSLFLFLSL